MKITWDSLNNFAASEYVCGYCHCYVASGNGWTGYENKNPSHRVCICPNCHRPTYFGPDRAQTPKVAFGKDVNGLPGPVESIYREARQCMAVASYTSAVLTCRKLLMHIAVEKGAPEGETFVKYIEHLATFGYVPPNGHGWVDHIRQKGNEANHEIAIMQQPDAEDLITFAEMLLRFIYEFPRRVSGSSPHGMKPSAG